MPAVKSSFLFASISVKHIDEASSGFVSLAQAHCGVEVVDTLVDTLAAAFQARFSNGFATFCTCARNAH